MKRSFLYGLVALLLGGGLGAGATWLAMRSRPGQLPGPPAAGRNAEPADEADPVVAALDADALFEQISGRKSKKGELATWAFGFPDRKYGMAVWEDQPSDDKGMRGRVEAAIKTAIEKGGGDRVVVTVGGKEQLHRSEVGTNNLSHRQHCFTCSYTAPIAGQARFRQAYVWVTTPVQGRQYSASLLFGK